MTALTNDLLTTKQLMELLQLDRTTIYRMLNDGYLPGVRMGGRWRFSRQAIDTWLAGQNHSESIHATNTVEQTAVALRADRVLPLDCLQPIQEVFALTSEMGAVMTDIDGNRLTPFSNPCAFCALILSTADGRANCQATWKRLAEHNGNPPRFEQCHAGLSCARGYIVVGNTPIAMLVVGQFVVNQPAEVRTHTHIAQIAQSCGVSEKKLGEAVRTLHVLPPARAEQLLGLAQKVADTCSHIAQERIDLLSRLKQVVEIAQVSAS